MKEFVIVLAGGVSNPVFYPGQAISGSIICENSVPKNFKAVKIRLEGRVDVSLRGARSLNSSLNNGLNASKIYINQSFILWSKTSAIQSGAGEQFPAGIQSIPFSFQLPQNIPPSFIGIWGSIRYFLEAKIVKEGKLKLDAVINTPLNVANVVVVDTSSITMSPTTLETQVVPTGILCCASSPIVLTVTIPKTGYCISNEPIPVRVQVENDSYFNVRNIEIYIEKRIVYNTGRLNNFQSIKLNSIFHNRSVNRHTSDDFEVSIVIDGNTPPTLINCEFIDINYFVWVVGVVSGKNLQLKIPITLGNAVTTDQQQPHPPLTSQISAPSAPQQPYLPRMDSVSGPYPTDSYPYQPYMESASAPPPPYSDLQEYPPPEPYPPQFSRIDSVSTNPVPVYPSAPMGPPEGGEPYQSATAPPPPPQQY